MVKVTACTQKAQRFHAREGKQVLLTTCFFSRPIRDRQCCRMSSIFFSIMSSCRLRLFLFRWSCKQPFQTVEVWTVELLSDDRKSNKRKKNIEEKHTTGFISPFKTNFSRTQHKTKTARMHACPHAQVHMYWQHVDSTPPSRSCPCQASALCKINNYKRLQTALRARE